MDQDLQSNVPPQESKEPAVPWSVLDNWIAVVILVLIDVILLVFALQDVNTQFLQSAGLAIAEIAYLLPVILIFAWKRIHWKHLGFGKFDSVTMGLGCGLLILAYTIIFLHNILLMALGVDTQGDSILKMFAELDSPFWFVLVGVVLAPFVEEIFFRGFLFQGFRQRYGWVGAMLISSAIFAVAHVDPVAFIPTFVLGSALAYVYHRSNSVWPGMILHFLVNAFGLCAAYAATRFPLPV